MLPLLDGSLVPLLSHSLFSFVLNGQGFCWLAGGQVQDDCLSWGLWKFGCPESPYHPDHLPGVGFSCIYGVCCSNWYRLYLCLFYYLVWVILLPIGSSDVVGETWPWRGSWDMWVREVGWVLEELSPVGIGSDGVVCLQANLFLLCRRRKSRRSSNYIIHSVPRRSCWQVQTQSLFTSWLLFP